VVHGGETANPASEQDIDSIEAPLAAPRRRSVLRPQSMDTSRARRRSSREALTAKTEMAQQAAAIVAARGANRPLRVRSAGARGAGTLVTFDAGEDATSADRGGRSNSTGDLATRSC